MSHATRRPRKSLEDYLSLPDEVQAELIDGELYVTPAPTFGHQDVVGRLYRALCDHVETRGLGRVGLSPLDVHLPSGDVVQPDLLFVSAARAEICRDFVDGAPDLVIEVLSSAHPERDRIVKRDLYERDGVPEYWLVDRADRSIEVLRLEGGTYGPAGWFTGAEALASRTFEGLAIPLSHVFGSAAS